MKKKLIQKNRFVFDKQIDFNLISHLLNVSEYDSSHSGNWYEPKVLNSVFQIKKVQGFDFIHLIYLNLESKFNLKKQRSDIDVFFSFQSGTRSIIHKDNYDVWIVGLLGKTLYKIENQEFIVCPGDLLHIPKNHLHLAIGIDPRIVLSYGIYNQ